MPTKENSPGKKRTFHYYEFPDSNPKNPRTLTFTVERSGYTVNLVSYPTGDRNKKRFEIKIDLDDPERPPYLSSRPPPSYANRSRPMHEEPNASTPRYDPSSREIPEVANIESVTFRILKNHNPPDKVYERTSFEKAITGPGALAPEFLAITSKVNHKGLLIKAFTVWANMYSDRSAVRPTKPLTRQQIDTTTQFLEVMQILRTLETNAAISEKPVPRIRE
jgi:hypothetical protein